MAHISSSVATWVIHTIPATAAEPTHLHYDVRFIFEANNQRALIISRESKDLAWVPVVDIPSYSRDRSILRMVDKMMLLSKNQ